MIQRIQSVWLFAAAFLSGALFLFPLYHYSTAASTDVQLLSARNEYLLLLLVTIMTLVPMVAIFLFKNRKQQKLLILVSGLAAVGFIAAMLSKIQALKQATPPAVQDNFAIPGPIIPVAVVLFLFLAYRGIRKDEALLKSVDRLR